MNRVTRLACPDVLPIQVWDLDLGGRKFWEVVSARNVYDMKMRRAAPLRIATTIADGITRGCAAIQHLGFDFGAVYLCGGVACIQGLQDALHGAGKFVFGGRDYAWEAKQALFGDDLFVVVDVGQTSIKAYLPDETRYVYERNTQTIPYGESPGKAEAAIRFIGGVIGKVAAAAPKAAILLSLPCPVDENLVPGENTYGFAGRADFVYEALLAAEVPAETPVHVINDAELAAECAREQVFDQRRVLALTLGLGPGAAIVDT